MNQTNISNEKRLIINNPEYFNLPFEERVAFLKKQHTFALLRFMELSRKYEDEISKLSDLPKDIAKYRDKSSINEIIKNRDKSEEKLEAIKQLIVLEIIPPELKTFAQVQNLLKQPKVPSKRHFWEDEDDDWD